MVFEDRISKYPGRWTLVREDGLSEIVTLVRNDEPIKDGTPINASTLNELSTVAGAINAKEEAVSAANSAAEERAKAEQAAKNAAKDVSAIVKADSENAALSAAAAKTSETNSKRSESQSATYLQGTKEYFEQVRTITIGAQGWYATPEALKAAVPIGENGWWAVVGTTDTIWTWDSDTKSWKNSIQKADLSDYYTKAQADAKFGTPYILPAATAAQLGGVKVGDYLDIAPDGTLSGKTLNDKIAAAVAVKSEARLVWSGKTTIGRRKTQTINVQDGVDYVNLRINETDFNLTPGMTYETGSFGAGSLKVTVLFSADKKRLECTLTNTLNTVSVVFTGYHYPTLEELLTETQAAQADTDALAVDQEYRVALLELGLTDDTTTDTRTT
jgi:predicted  nucleic acid-binding Zn-ribbon protein